MSIFDNLFGKENRMEKQKDKRRKENYALRDKFWESIGNVDSDILAFMINPAFMDKPCWPDLRQAYKKIATKNSVILATDGLTDEFSDSNKPNNGFRIEFLVEVCDKELMNKTLDEIRYIICGEMTKEERKILRKYEFGDDCDCDDLDFDEEAEDPEFNPFP